MKTLSGAKAFFVALLAFVLMVASALAFTACTNDGDETSESVTKKYDATFSASIVMGPMGEQSLAGVYSATYVTEKDGNYTLTVIFQKGELHVSTITGDIFVDDDPNDSDYVDVENGVIGFYNESGSLVTEGVKVTYSSGDNYGTTPAGDKVYYVQSAEFPVDSLRENYELTLYINSNMMGKQFSKSTYSAKLALDLDSGKEVEAVSGLGVATKGTVSDGSAEAEYVKYGAELNAVVSMANNNVNFTENLLDGVYVTEKDGKFEITVIFKTGVVNMPFGNVMTGYMNSAPTEDHFGNEVVPQFGLVVEGEAVTDGVVLTYSSGKDYVSTSTGNFYYVKSMTFTADALEENYTLAVYVNAYNETSVSGMQFPYTSSSVVNAELTLDLEDSEGVESIENLLGVATLGEAPQPVEPSEGEYVKYGAELNAVVSMGTNTVNFTENLLDGVYVTEKDGNFEITVMFKTGVVNMPFGNVMTGYMHSAPTEDHFGNEVVPQFGLVVEGEVVTDGVVLTYSSGNDYVSTSAGNFYYVKSMTFTADALEENYTLAVYVNAYNETSVSGMQFPYKSSSVVNAELTLDLEDGESVESIESLLGVATLGEAPQPVVPSESVYSEYEASLSCNVTVMNIDFGGVLDSVYVHNDDGDLYLTVTFKKNEMKIMGVDCTAFIDDNADGLLGYYDGETLVTDVVLTYSTGNDYVTDSTGSNVYYVKSMTFAIDELAESYNLALYINSDRMGTQFSSEEGAKYPAVLTVDLSSATDVEEIGGLGVETKGEVSEEE